MPDSQTPPTARDWSPELDVLIAQIGRYYLDPEVGERICRLLRERLAGGGYAGIADEAAFADAVTEDLQSINGDQHLFLQYVEQEIPESTVDEGVDDAVLRAERAVLSGHGFAKVQRLPGNVGLLDIRHFYQPSVAGAGVAATAAMHLVAGADALVIDLRQCNGGEPDMVVFLLSYLFDGHTELTSLVFPAEGKTIQAWTGYVPGPKYGGSKPLYVLISSSTASGAEAFAYDLQQHKRATLIGVTTTGAANFHYPYRVSAHLLSAVPSGYPRNPISGQGWEGVGIQPDLAVPAERAFDTAYRLALEHVCSLGTAGARRRVVAEASQALAELP